MTNIVWFIYTEATSCIGVTHGDHMHHAYKDTVGNWVAIFSLSCPQVSIAVRRHSAQGWSRTLHTIHGKATYIFHLCACVSPLIYSKIES